MKKLFSLIAALLVFAGSFIPQPAQAAGACVFFWTPLTIFFQAGGSVQVVHSNGTSYDVNASNVVSGNQYGLAQGDHVNVWAPPNSCLTWYWGNATFGACNNQGGITYGAPLPVAISGVHETTSLVVITCDCPNGSSSAALQWVSSWYCSIGGGGGGQ